MEEILKLFESLGGGDKVEFFKQILPKVMAIVKSDKGLMSEIIPLLTNEIKDSGFDASDLLSKSSKITSLFK
jgi:hypothetical protein